MKTLARILLTLALVLSFVTPAVAGDEGPINGSFTLKVPPVITNVNIYSDNSLTTVATSLKPTTYYWVKVSVTDNDGLDDLDNIKVAMYYASADAPGTTAIDSNVNGEGNAALQEVMTWTRSTNAITHVLSGTTWDAIASPANPLPADTKIADGTATTSYDFVFKVKIGKVAAETVTLSSNRWQIAAVATDSGAERSRASYNVTGVYGLGMDWYGEIVVPSTSKLDWGSVQTGLDFGNSNGSGINPTTTDGDNATMTYISNGDYSDGVKVVTENLSWKTASSDAVTLKNNHSNASNTFSLRVKKGTESETPSDETIVQDNSYTSYTAETGTRTSESGIADGLYYVYLSLSDNITYPGTYTGAINFVISNR